MKKYLVTAALVLASSTVFASKARVSSLQGADHIVDAQTAFTNPAHILLLNPYLTFEMGVAGTDAEGGFLRKASSGAMYGAYLGHKVYHYSATVTDLRTGLGYIGMNNPIDVFYGTNNWAIDVAFSTVDNKKSGTKETTLIAKFGQNLNSDLSWYAHLEALSQANKTSQNDKFTGAPWLTVGGAMNHSDLRFFGELQYGTAKNEPSTGSSSNIKDTNFAVGVLDHSLKTKDADIYYGTKLVYLNRDIEGNKINGTALPVFCGLEMGVTSWAVFRGSVQQNMILGAVKDETATNKDADGISNNTTVAAGLGLKYNNLTLDGALTAATSGAVNGSSFLSQASVTYNF